MADREYRFEDNVAGKFFVEEACICCRICGELAPDFFRESDEGGHHFIYRQPTGETEIELAMEALEECPVGAIGDDG